MKRFLTLFLCLGASIATAQVSPIVASNHWSDRHEWGGFQLRYWKGDEVAGRVSANSIVSGEGLAVIREQHAMARSAGAFTVHRTIYNYHRSNEADKTGLSFKVVRHWDDSIGWVVDYDHEPNLEIIRSIELSVKREAGHLIDAVQIGWGLLNENNFGRGPPPVSTDGMFSYFEVMRDVWGDKLMVCIGGAYGPPDNPAFTRRILTRIAETGYRFLSEFQDSWGREIWNTQYHFAYEIWEDHGIEPPIISWREVTGGCNQWEAHPAVRKSPGALFAEHFERRYSFMHNMGCWPSYRGTEAFIDQVMEYLPQQVASYREALGTQWPVP